MATCIRCSYVRVSGHLLYKDAETFKLHCQCVLVDEQAVILGAIREWEKHTCLTFIPKRDSDKNYIRFYNGSCG